MNTIIIDEKTVSIDGVIYERKESEFQVGQWVMGINGFTPYNPARISKVKNGDVLYLYWNGEEEIQSFQNNNALRPATHSEIEQHLIKVAKEKGFKEGVKVKCLACGTYNLGNISEYRMSDDRLFFCQQGLSRLDHDSEITLYQQGKWAEILPEKKKLPIGKQGFRTLFNDWSIAGTISFDQFLEQYED